MSDTPKTPPTAEQIAQIIDSNSVVIVKGERVLNPGRNIAPLILAALAPAERAEAVPECWALYQQSDGKRLNSITFPDVGSAMQAAGCTANPVTVRGLYAEGPTRTGALDAAGTKVAKLEATLRTISSLPRDSFDRAKYLADAALAAGDGDLK